MELQPRLPSERAIRSVVAGVGSLAAVSGYAFAIDLVRASSVATVAAAVVLGSLMAWFVLIRPLVRVERATRVESALDRFECVARSASRTLLVCAALGLFARGALSHVLSVVSCVACLSVIAMAALRDRARVRALRRIYAGEDPSLRVVRDVDVRGYELLPPVLSGTLTNAVIAHVRSPSAPVTYRDSHGPRPLARCDVALPKMLKRVTRRARASAGLAAGALGCALLLPFASHAHATRLANASVGATAIDVPACTDARVYFADRLENGGFGRATLLTHAQDPSIAAGQGVLLVVPQGQLRPATASEKDRALAIARDIPCKDKLALRVEDAQLRPFTVEATLVLEPAADEARVLSDATEQVRELFLPDSRTIFNEHTGFGESEKTFGYRVRHVLHHVQGVRGVRLTVNGSEHDLALEPRDFPTLESLTLHAER